MNDREALELGDMRYFVWPEEIRSALKELGPIGDRGEAFVKTAVEAYLWLLDGGSVNGQRLVPLDARVVSEATTFELIQAIEAQGWMVPPLVNTQDPPNEAASVVQRAMAGESVPYKGMVVGPGMTGLFPDESDALNDTETP